MAYFRANKTGNWSDTTAWDTWGGASWAAAGAIPAAGDVVYANGQTITIDVTTAAVTSINTSVTVTVPPGTGTNAGGGFTLATGVTLNAASVQAGTTTCVTFQTDNGNSTIVGNIVGGTSANAYGVYVSIATVYKAIALTVTGNVTGGTNTNTYGLYIAAARATVTVTGNVAAGAGTTAYGIYSLLVTSSDIAGLLTINGTVTASGTVYAVYISQHATYLRGGACVINPGATAVSGIYAVTAGNAFTVNGDVAGTGSLIGATFAGFSGPHSITGNVTGGSATNIHGVSHAGSGMVTIGGNVTGGTNTSAYGVLVSGPGTVTVSGYSIGGTAGPGCSVNNNGYIHIATVKGTVYGGAQSSPATYGLVSDYRGFASCNNVLFGDNGMSPINGFCFLLPLSTSYCQMRNADYSTRTFSDPANTAGVMPAASDVRYGTSYDGGNRTGTMHVPAAGSVRIGVSTGTTVGTAALLPADILDYDGDAVPVSGSILERAQQVLTQDSALAMLGAFQA